MVALWLRDVCWWSISMKVSKCDIHKAVQLPPPPIMAVTLPPSAPVRLPALFNLRLAVTQPPPSSLNHPLSSDETSAEDPLATETTIYYDWYTQSHWTDMVVYLFLLGHCIYQHPVYKYALYVPQMHSCPYRLMLPAWRLFSTSLALSHGGSKADGAHFLLELQMGFRWASS